jgi:Flp pilus assembly protein TadG
MSRRTTLLADDGGATLVEFALIAPLFFGLLLGIIQVGVLGVVSASFNNGLLVASREIRVGDPPKNAGKFKDRICAAMASMGPGKCRQRLTVDVTPVDSFAAASTRAQQTGGASQPADAKDDDDDTKFNHGAASQVMLVTATYRWPFWVPFIGAAFPRDGGDVVLTSRITFKNEPYNL